MEKENLIQDFIIGKFNSFTKEPTWLQKDGEFGSMFSAHHFHQYTDAIDKIRSLPLGMYICQRVFNVIETEVVKEVDEDSEELTQYDYLILIETTLKEADVLPFDERVKMKRAILDRYEIIKR